MVEPLVDQIGRKIGEVGELYHRLVLVVAPSGGGKTSALLDLQHRTGVPYWNVNLELSRRMLELTQRQRTLRIPQLLDEFCGAGTEEAVLLDNTEILFDVNLKQDPLRLLQGLSRTRTVVAAWNGTVIDGSLTYAEPGHPEYRRYAARDLVIVVPETSA